MTAKFSEINGVAKMNMLYTCSVCGRVEKGTTERLEFSGPCPEAIKNQLESVQVTSHHMPYGWSYCDTFKCSNC
jgi:hypothetical protein